MSSRPIRVALVHDWLTGMRGGEYVLEAIAELLPSAELFTLISFPSRVSARLASLPQRVSWLQGVPGIESRYRYFLPILPRVIESFDLTGFDLVISSSHCVAKGVRKAPGAVHLSYVHAPMRYIWDRYEDYFGKDRASPAVRLAARALRGRLRKWDRASSSIPRVDRLVANSRYIARQIENAYDRRASVVYPFADLARFARPHAPRETCTDYLMVGAFAPNKRVDIAIEAFNRLKKPLLIVGSGQEERKLRAMAGPTVQFLGPCSNERIVELYSRCRAFVFPGLEDFGITPVEAMAAGAPVIAYGEGGVLETVTPQTGVFFNPQTPDALMAAIGSFENGVVSEEACRNRAAEFSKDRFQREFARELRETWIEAGKDPQSIEIILSRAP